MDGVLAGVIEKLSSGFASGGDIRLEMVGKRDMLGGCLDEPLTDEGCS